MKLISVVTLICILFSNCVFGQNINSASPTQRLFVFLDCNARNCDFDHFRREITWVNWVRDRQDSDIHLLITSQRTGGGGLQYTLDYIGRRANEGVEKSTLYISDPNDTDTEVRNQLTTTMALGLVQFIENNPQIASRLRIIYDEPAIDDDAGPIISEEDDPWDLWVFRLGMEGSIEGESQQKAYSLEGSTSARRVAEDFKIELELDAEYDREEFDEIGAETFVNISQDYSAELLAVWSLSPHWSLGGLGEVSKSTFNNLDLSILGGPALEYNIFPYSESTRRAITFRYSIELASFNYELITVVGKTKDIFGRHSLAIRTEVQQEWGEIFGIVEGIQYFDDPSTHRINTLLRLEYRLFRGFNVDIFLRFSRIKDQFFLPATDLSAEEILLRRRQRETDFQFDIGVGLSYRFGSKFSNIVNPRID